MSGPLNPELYRRLRERFGKVIIANAGMEMVGYRQQDAFDPKRSEYVVATWGEYMRVPCHWCKETRCRLWINYLYGTALPDSGYGATWLAHCYNCEEPKNPARQEELRQLIFGLRNSQDRYRKFEIKEGEKLDASLQVMGPPGEILSLDRLPPNHIAITYLAERRHYLDLLRQYEVGYVLRANDDTNSRRQVDRIYIPVKMHGQLVGWQTRYMGELPSWKQIHKYDGPSAWHKTGILYNFDVAKNWPFVVVVEGVTSVWRIGPPAVAILGKSLHGPQQALLAQHWLGKPVIIILDPDARDNMEGIIRELRIKGHVLVPIYIPEGYDPDKYEHETIKNMIKAECSRQHGIRCQTGAS